LHRLPGEKAKAQLEFAIFVITLLWPWMNSIGKEGNQPGDIIVKL
tara:strand:+ start:81 stop:215 length:135 start_codon:yes stop_codon:yes gene_type:complete